MERQEALTRPSPEEETELAALETPASPSKAELVAFAKCQSRRHKQK
jgi:hypothetical protein